MIPPQIPDEIPDETYVNLGKVNAYFAVLEFQLKLLVWALLRTDQFAAEVVMAKLSFRNLLDVAAALVRLRFKEGEVHAECDELAKRADAVEQRRNAIVHSMWTADSRGEIGRIKWKASRRKGHEVEYEQVASGALEAVITEIAETSKGFGRFSKKVAM